MTVRVTHEKLRQLGACDESIAMFKRLFPVSRYPDGVRVTTELCVQHADEFDWSWAVRHLVPGDSVEDRETAFHELIRDALRAYEYATMRPHTEAPCATCRRIEETARELERAEARAFAQLIRYPALRTPRGLPRVDLGV